MSKLAQKNAMERELNAWANSVEEAKEATMVEFRTFPSRAIAIIYRDCKPATSASKPTFRLSIKRDGTDVFESKIPKAAHSAMSQRFRLGGSMLVPALLAMPEARKELEKIDQNFADALVRAHPAIRPGKSRRKPPL